MKTLPPYNDHQQGKLVMTLLVRNEEDIVRYNIDFHLSRGVDYIIATDNASTDGTAAVLEEYEQKGLLHLIVETSHDHNQAAWNNRMAQIAKQEYGADIIFHCDADEFWHPRSGNLKDEILKRPEDILRVDVINVLLTDRDGAEVFPGDTRYAVVNPLIAADYQEESKHQNFFYFVYPPKVMFKTAKKVFFVRQGNHSVSNQDEDTREGVSCDVAVYHYPIRSRARFYDKTLLGGAAYENSKIHPLHDGFHKRRWYAAYKDGRLDDEYRKLLLPRENITDFLKEGFIEEKDFDEIILGKNNHQNRWTHHYRLFEYETIFDDPHSPWAGHKYFAYDLVRNIKPQIVVDLKTDNGSSFLSFCQAVKDGRFDARLYCIDAGAGHDLLEADWRMTLENIQAARDQYYRGLTIEMMQKTPEEAVLHFQDGSIDLLNADGFCTFEDIRRHIGLWLPKVKPDGMILIHDVFTKNNDSRIYQYWEELKKEYRTIEFHHSYGLGVICLSEKIYQDFMRRERDWQMEYASRAFDRQCKALQASLEYFRKNLLADFNNIMAERDHALALVDEMKASKSWKLTAPIRSMNHILRQKIYSAKRRVKTK